MSRCTSLWGWRPGQLIRTRSRTLIYPDGKAGAMSAPVRHDQIAGVDWHVAPDRDDQHKLTRDDRDDPGVSAR
jgi:hypothetical protein